MTYRISMIFNNQVNQVNQANHGSDKVQKLANILFLFRMGVKNYDNESNFQLNFG
jgi:hypothetical protein